MKKGKFWCTLTAVLAMYIVLSMNVFAEGEQEIVFVSEEVISVEEEIVGAGLHSTVMIDPDIAIGTAVFSNNTKVSLKLNCRAFGNSMEDYRVEIYKGDTAGKDGYVLVARGVNTFRDMVGTYNTTFEFNTPSNVFTPGTYTVVCTSCYYTDNGSQMINQSDRALFTIEDYHLVLDREFVSRLYLTALERTVDPTGLQNWSNELYSGKLTGAQVVAYIFESKEFVDKNKTDEEYVDLLYRAIFDRKPDAAGKQHWLDFLNTGFSRRKVLKGFTDSQEFENLCNTYEVVKGTVELTEYRDLNEGVTGFVSRLYNLALLRRPDVAGLNNWTEQLLGKKTSPQSVAHGFVFSKEMNERNLSNEDFVSMLYNTMLGRWPDGPGLADWVKQLDGGTKTREDIFAGFANSKEFSEIVKSYNIQ